MKAVTVNLRPRWSWFYSVPLAYWNTTENEHSICVINFFLFFFSYRSDGKTVPPHVSQLWCWLACDEATSNESQNIPSLLDYFSHGDLAGKVFTLGEEFPFSRGKRALIFHYVTLTHQPLEPRGYHQIFSRGEFLRSKVVECCRWFKQSQDFTSRWFWDKTHQLWPSPL